MNREQRRARAKLEKKNDNSDMAEKISLFGKLENSCLVCAKPFDKKDKEMVMSWSVVVREKEEKVNLYCPECWSGALDMLRQARSEILGE
jgi:uncharacterized protein with PIN domain